MKAYMLPFLDNCYDFSNKNVDFFHFFPDGVSVKEQAKIAMWYAVSGSVSEVQRRFRAE